TLIILVQSIPGQRHPQASSERLMPFLVGHLSSARSKPGDVLYSHSLDGTAVEEIVTAKARMLAADRDCPAGKSEQVASRGRHLPVDPTEFVVLAVRIIVAVLGAAELVTSEMHRDALRQHQSGDKVALLLR